jgi:putative transposase
LQALLPVWKAADSDFEDVYSKLLQYELHRLFSNISAMKAMRRRGRKIGKLRFKIQCHFKTFSYNQSGFNIIPKNKKFGFLHLSKIGDIPIRLHREIVGHIKGITVKHAASGKWYAHIIVDNGTRAPGFAPINRSIALDVGLTTYIVDSDANEVENPHHLKKALKKLRREQRRLGKCQKDSINREKQRIEVARQYERVKNLGEDFHHKLARHYVDRYDLVVTERLSINSMIKDHRFARSISDAAWESLNHKIAYKAENAGKLFVQVNPRNTSQLCSKCGVIVPKTLAQRVHCCPNCGVILGRDYNSSLVILERGLQKIRSERPEFTLADNRPLCGTISPVQVDCLKQEIPLKVRDGSPIGRNGMAHRAPG